MCIVDIRSLHLTRTLDNDRNTRPEDYKFLGWHTENEGAPLPITHFTMHCNQAHTIRRTYTTLLCCQCLTVNNVRCERLML